VGSLLLNIILVIRCDGGLLFGVMEGSLELIRKLVNKNVIFRPNPYVGL
jgi:hypothetical protein